MVFEDFVYYINSSNNVVIAKYVGVDTDITIPDIIDGLTVTEIADYAFYKSPVRVCTFQNFIYKIGESAFEKSKLEILNVGSSLTYIGNRAFCECNKLYKIDGELNYIESIGEYAFYQTYSLRKFWIAKGRLSYIAPFAFQESNIQSVRIRGSHLIIGDCAFFNCQNLANVQIAYISSIRDNAFTRDYNLKSITIGCEEKMKLGYDIFVNENIILRYVYFDNQPHPNPFAQLNLTNPHIQQFFY